MPHPVPLDVLAARSYFDEFSPRSPSELVDWAFHPDGPEGAELVLYAVDDFGRVHYPMLAVRDHTTWRASGYKLVRYAGGEAPGEWVVLNRCVQIHNVLSAAVYHYLQHLMAIREVERAQRDADKGQGRAGRGG